MRSSWPPWAGCIGTTPSGCTATSATSRLSSSRLSTPPMASWRPQIQTTQRSRTPLRGPQIASQRLKPNPVTGKSRQILHRTLLPGRPHPLPRQQRGPHGRRPRPGPSRSCAAAPAPGSTAPGAGRGSPTEPRRSPSQSNTTDTELQPTTSSRQLYAVGQTDQDPAGSRNARASIRPRAVQSPPDTFLRSYAFACHARDESSFKLRRAAQGRAPGTATASTKRLDGGSSSTMHPQGSYLPTLSAPSNSSLTIRSFEWLS